MDLQNEAIELQKVFHKGYKTYYEETEAIKAHLEARFKALGIVDVVVPKGTLCDVCGSENTIGAPHMGANCLDCNPL